jgi:hypothetical protein
MRLQPPKARQIRLHHDTCCCCCHVNFRVSRLLLSGGACPLAVLGNTVMEKKNRYTGYYTHGDFDYYKWLPVNNIAIIFLGSPMKFEI